MLLPDLEEAEVNEGLKEDLALHLVYPDWQFNSESFLTDYFDDFSFVFELLAFIFDFGGGGESGGDLGLHGIDDFEVGVFWFVKSYPFGSVGEIPNLNGDFVVLVDLDVLEDDFRGDDLEGLRVEGRVAGILFFWECSSQSILHK